MTEKKKHIEQSTISSEKFMDMISNTSIHWDKSKEQVWDDLERRMDASQIQDASLFFSLWVRVPVVASIIFLVGFLIFIQLHSKTFLVPAGEQGNIILPDLSKVHINAQSIISYKPLLWKFSHRVKLDGEAYFEVTKGKKFEVVSGSFKTIVLGTNFNIYARNNEYMVTCVSGKVKVVEVPGNQEVLLQPGQRAEFKQDKVFKVHSDINTEQTISWLNNRFVFTSVPIRKVFDEIERQYGVLILISGDIHYIYTGNFNRSTSVENVLNLVCKPFNLEFTRKSKNEYIISKAK